MPQALIANSAATTLSTAITTTGQLSMVVVDASKFPVPSGGDYFYCTLLDASNIPEIVKVTAVAGTTFTIVRGQDGSAARTFTTGASVRLALTKAVMDEYARLALSAQKAGDTYTGAHNFSAASAVTLPAATSIGPVTPTILSYTANLTSDAQAQINSKAPSDSPTFSGTVSLPSTTGIGTVTSSEIGRLSGVTSNVQTQLDGKATLASPAFTGSPTAPTPTFGDSTNKLATTAFVAAAAFSSVLPGQTGNAGKFVTTDGTNASWADPLPSQTGNAGKFVTTDGTSASWADPVPTQTGNAGKFLQTNGTSPTWQPEGGAVTVVSGTTQTAVAGNQYALTNASASTLTLPASASAGDTVIVCIGNSRTDNVIARNGNTIMGIAEDMTVDNANATVTLRYLNNSWRLV